jgi:hypothetical protein
MHGSSFVEGFSCDLYPKYRVSTFDISHFFAHYLITIENKVPWFQF